jgi:probable F420-dependent oxidoreductase
MKFGYMTMNSASGMHPAPLARELEQRGFESLWVPEHSHIPTDRRSPYPSGGELPEGYLHMMSPLVSLAAAAAATERLLVGTAVCLILEHDLLDLAVQAATLDVISGGRLRLGIGVGWNVEELANHRPDLPFRLRYSALRERVAALRTIWSADVASFSGRWERFTPSWIYPKPVERRIPIVMGASAPLGIVHAAGYADEWMPIDGSLLGANGRPDVAAGVARFRNLLVEKGRDPARIPVSLLMFARPKPERIERYAAVGIERVVITPPSAQLWPAAATLAHLDEVTPIVKQFSA